MKPLLHYSEAELRQMTVGEGIDALAIHNVLEPMPPVETIGALRERYRSEWRYSTCDFLSWEEHWRAEIGTDGGEDHEMCFWHPNLEPSASIEVAWLLGQKAREEGYQISLSDMPEGCHYLTNDEPPLPVKLRCQANFFHCPSLNAETPLRSPLRRIVALADTPELALCRAALLWQRRRQAEAEKQKGAGESYGDN